MNILELIKSNIFKDKNIPHLQTNPGIGDMLNCYVYSSELLQKYEKIKVNIIVYIRENIDA